MLPPLSSTDLQTIIEGASWRRRFDPAALALGAKFARARQVARVTATLLEGGDAEITGAVTDREGATHLPVLTFWREGESPTFDSSCSCPVATGCPHAAALFEYLSKATAARLAQALGDPPTPAAIAAATPLDPPPARTPDHPPTPAPDPSAPRFLLRLSRRPPSSGFAWLPDRYGQAFAIYGGHRAPLSPAGHLPPIVTPDGKIARDRASETAALVQLYSLDLVPGAEQPPQSLRKLATPPDIEGTLWSVDQKAWPHPDLYWQRFRHEGAPALERRGWEVRYAPDFGLQPLSFRTATWRAEIVEEGRGWFHLNAGFEIDGERFALQPILAALLANGFLERAAPLPDGQEFLIFLPDGRSLTVPVGRFRRILTALRALSDFPFPDGPIRLSKIDAALLVSPQADAGLDAPPPQGLEALADSLADLSRIPPTTPPDSLQASLREYQLDGFRWMQHLARHDLHGILADDMGLGKTLQAIAHLLAERDSGRSQGKPSLVIAPTSVVMNWQREAAKFAPSLQTLVLQGPARHQLFPLLAKTDLALTSYALIHRDLDSFLPHHFHLLLLDEAQHIKNPDALTSAAVRQLHADHRLCLSGTPVENHLGELWSLFHFLMPGFLSTRDNFTATYRNPIEKDADPARRADLARRVGPLILRRTKHEVAKELPPKTEIIHTLAMGQDQADLYETVRSTMDRQVRQALALRGQESRIVFLDALLKLRQICCHPALLSADHRHAPSAKFEALADLLEIFRAEGNRVLLFSQFTSMLSLIEEHLIAERFSYLKLTGATTGRQELVERFQSGEGEVFLISLKAGGTGLTLTGADIVIHYDPWWNPAAEDQATDRAYRIGQDRPVFVHKLICEGTVEERIQQMQQRKDNLASDLLSGATSHLPLTPDLAEALLSPSPLPDTPQETAQESFPESSPKSTQDSAPEIRDPF